MKQKIQLLALSICVFAVSLAAAPVKVAIVGNAAMAELLQSKLTGTPEVELYERDQIKSILAEHKLSALSAGKLRELFPHVDFFAVLEPSAGTADRLVVFDARSGYRAADIALPAPPGEAVGRAETTIKKAIARTPGSTTYLALHLVRDSGVPFRYLPMMETFVRQFEQTLGADDQIVLLERGRLDNTARERELTSILYPLQPSTLLLRLEFTPGSLPEIVHCTARVTNLDKKILKKIHRENVFSDMPVSIGELIAEIKQVKPEPVKTPPAPPAKTSVSKENLSVPYKQRRLEAKRYFEAYKAAKSAEEKSAALQAALALDPRNQTYIRGNTSVLFLLAKEKQTPAERLAGCRAMLDWVKKQDKHNDSFILPLPQKEYTFITPGNQNGIVQRPTLAEWEEITLLSAEACACLEERLNKRLSAISLRSVNQWSLYLNKIYKIYFNKQLHVDEESFREAQARGVRVSLELMQNQLKKHPVEKAADWNKIEEYCNGLNHPDLWKFNREALYSNIEFAEQSGIRPFQRLALGWKLLREIQQSQDETPEAFRTRVESYFSQVHELYGGERPKNVDLWPLTQIHYKGLTEKERNAILKEIIDKTWPSAPKGL